MKRCAGKWTVGDAGSRTAHKLLWLAAFLALACGEDTAAEGAAGAGGGTPAAASGGRSGRGSTGRSAAAGRLAGGSPAGGAGGSVARPDADAGPPEEAFSIALSTSECRDGCPAYDLKVDQRGALEFNGRGHTRQQGWAGKSVPPAAAEELLQALRDARYWELKESYRNESDGCASVAADRATHTWNVTAQGRAKIVVDYQGCTGVSQLEELRALTTRLREKLQLDNWIGL